MNLLLPTFHFNIEHWKWNKEYQVYASSLGNFKDANKEDLKVNIDSNGYCRIRTILGMKKAHRIVMETFKPCENYDNLTVDHLNHNKRDNSLFNLEWVTEEVNQTRAKVDYINVQDKMKLSTTTFIQCDRLKFESYEAAARYIMEICGVKEETHMDTVIKHIKKAITQRKTYANKNWSFVEL